MTTYYIALGSNLGDRLMHLSQACERLAFLGEIVAQSSVVITEPMYLEEQPDFYNAAVALRCDLQPEELLGHLQATEVAGGRVRQVRNGPRTIDLDIIDAGCVLETPSLSLPHPRLAERPFVIFPLREVAPDWVHPVTGVHINALCHALSAPGVVKPAPW